jgi:dTDP-glucose 4,6-dehydratase
MRKNILITGGAGFIGSNFIRYILKKRPHSKIINLDKLTYAGNLDNLDDIKGNKNHRFIKGDICDSRLVNKIVKECSIIINFAAETHVDRSIKSASMFIRTNVQGTYVLLEAAKAHKIKLFLQISTDEVYGSCEEGYFREDSPLIPNSPYAASKAAADMLVHAYHVTYKLPIVITRSSNNFGPYQYPEKVIPLFISRALEDKYLPLYGRGENIRDWIYVTDNCSAMDLVLRKGTIGEVYNISGGNLITNIELAKLILKKLRKPQVLIKSVKDRPGHDWRYALECSKIIHLGWRPKFAFEKALEDTINWYIQNKQWWKRKK